MEFTRLEELPAAIRRYIRELVGNEGAEWVRKPIPALGNSTFLQYLNEKGMKAAAEYLSNVGTKYGLPHGCLTGDTLSDLIQRVRDLVQGRAAQDPAEMRYRVLLKELDRVQAALEVGSFRFREKETSFGLFAVRELEDDPELCDALIELDGHLKFLIIRISRGFILARAGRLVVRFGCEALLPGHDPDLVVYASDVRYEPPDHETEIDTKTRQRLLKQLCVAVAARAMTVEVE